MTDVYRDQALYTDGFKDGYAQAIADADYELRKHGDDRQTRLCRRDVLALAKVSYAPEDAMPRPDWSQHLGRAPTPHVPPSAPSESSSYDKTKDRYFESNQGAD